MTLAAGTPIGKYVVRRKLAEGGMAEIYLAAALGPEGFEKDVVIKRVRPGLAGDPEFVRMFIAEARVASRLNHANLVHIFDLTTRYTYYLAMDTRGHHLNAPRCQNAASPSATRWAQTA
jgi:serine/threonine-protein kinase